MVNFRRVCATSVCMQSLDPRRIYYVYMIFRPNGVPCYVGKGHHQRWQRHLRSTHNKYLSRIIAKADGNVPIVKLRDTVTEAEAMETEMAYIAAIGRIKVGGPLVNMTDGGEGVSGMTQSAHQRNIASITHTGNKYSVGAKRTKESRAKMRTAKLGKPLSASHRRSIGDAHIGRIRDPSVGEKISAAKLGKKWSEEHKAILKAANRSREPEVRERIRQGNLRAIEEKRRANECSN